MYATCKTKITEIDKGYGNLKCNVSCYTFDTFQELG